MDIKKLQPEVEVTYDLDTTGEPITIMFRVGFIALDAVQDYVNESMDAEHCIDKPRPRISDVIRRAVSDAIHGWDLMEGPNALACTRENKDKYLPLLFGLKTKQSEVIIDGEPIPTDPVASVLVRALAEFAGNPENFLKN
jgi:hypothetical protein